MSVSSKKKTADKLFSEIIRRSCADTEGYVSCVTCKVSIHWTEADAGHYESRRHNNTRYDERNVWPQCRTCNRFEEGRKYEFGKFLVEQFGEGIIHELREAAHQIKRFTEPELQELINRFRKELRDLD